MSKVFFLLEAAGLANIATGALFDVFGRKLPIISSLLSMCLLTLSMGFWGTNIWSLIFFTIIHNGKSGTIPYYYHQNKVFPLKYIFNMNEIGTFANVLLSLFFALYAAFLFNPFNTTIWYVLSGPLLLEAIVIGPTMPETYENNVLNQDFI